LLTSKAKYALRAMTELATLAAERDWRQPVFISEIAERQNIPRRFLENILLELRKHGLVVSHRGKHGGYALAREPARISFADVIRAMDGPLAFTPCTSRTRYHPCDDCVSEAKCRLRLALMQAREAAAEILERTSLADAAATGADAPI